LFFKHTFGCKNGTNTAPLIINIGTTWVVNSYSGCFISDGPQNRFGRFWRKVPWIYRDSNLQDHPARSLGAITNTAPTFKRILLTNYQQNVIRVTNEFFTATFGHDHDKNGFNIKWDTIKQAGWKKWSSRKSSLSGFLYHI